MKPIYLGLAILALCLVDCAATQCEWYALPTVEGNFLMDWMINTFGWGVVWGIKMATGAVFVPLAGPLYRTITGRRLMWFVLTVYGVICGLHVVIAVSS